ncbi:MAG: phosphodiester glycosidase family protein [Solirubrobacteraceae bacterium]
MLTAASLLALVPALLSFAGMLVQPSNTSLSIRAVEWLRSNGASSLVSRVETTYYTIEAPATGGPTLHALPPQASAANTSPVRIPHSHRFALPYQPQRIAPVIHPALPGEGVWRPTFAGGGSRPPVLITSFRTDPSYPGMVAGVAWMDAAQTSIWLYPGRDEPAVSMASRGPEEVPPDKRAELVATFNSAFKLADSGGGFASGGHTYAPMKDGLATILRYRGGGIALVDWHGGPAVGPDVIYARQNLPLIVSQGRLNPNLSSGPEWGVTVGDAIRVWRSGLGVDRRGNLIYAVANDQTVRSLAEILRRAGAVRAMELDINSYWPSFITYRHTHAGDPSNLLPGMSRSPYRYLTPDDRDFFAVYLR